MKTARQFVTFLAVGAVNTVFGYSVFAGLILAGAAPVPALVVTYLVGVPFNFLTTGRFVFHRIAVESFPRFVLAYVVIYVFNVALFKALESLGATPLVAQALCVPPVAVFSFLLFKLAVFR